MAERPIVVGCEGGERDRLALARALAVLTGAPIEVVCVYPRGPRSNRSGGGAFEDVTRRDAEATLARAREELADLPSVRFRCLTASTPVLGLELAVAESDAAILVLGSTPRGGIGRVLPGSTGQQALAGVPCAIALAPFGYAAHAAPPALIGVGSDGSEQSVSALRYAVELAAGGAAIRVIGAFDPTSQLADPLAPMYGKPPRVEEIRRDARQALERCAATVPGGAQFELLEGSPAACLSRASHGVDLLVLGSHRRGPLRRVLLASVSSRVVEHVDCPVLVLPRTAVAAPHADGADPASSAAA